MFFFFLPTVQCLVFEILNSSCEKGFSIKDIDLFLMQTIALVCAFTIEIKETNINCSTSYPYGCLH
jgi:hypothetical protein